MNIFGEKVILRALRPCDANLLLGMINDPDTEKMLGGSSFPVSLEGQEKWIDGQIGRNNTLRCIIVLPDEEDVGLGTVILSNIDTKNGVAQVHIKLDKEKGRGHGYGSDALRAIVKYAFDEMRLNCIYADVLSYNIPSQRLFQKCGFERDGILRSRVYKSGQYHDVYSYSILNRAE